MNSLNYQKACFLTSVAEVAQLPADQGAEVVFAGRSNVGKSSALNALTQHKNLARTSKTPGRTQLINFFALDPMRKLVDLPGYGYAKVSRSIQQRWQQNLEDYLSHRQCIRGMVLLMDIRHPLKAFDWMMLQYACHQQIPVHILLTKADKLGRGARLVTLNKTQKALKEYPSVSIQLFSTLNKTGLEELALKLDAWIA